MSVCETLCDSTHKVYFHALCLKSSVLSLIIKKNFMFESTLYENFKMLKHYKCMVASSVFSIFVMSCWNASQGTSLAGCIENKLLPFSMFILLLCAIDGNKEVTQCIHFDISSSTRVAVIGLGYPSECQLQSFSSSFTTKAFFENKSCRARTSVTFWHKSCHMRFNSLAHKQLWQGQSILHNHLIHHSECSLGTV